ncbi:MAG TPA: FHA domain-containing protein, partial [Gemmatimonadales bacterium]
MTIGTDPASKIPIDAPGVAPHHAVVEQRDRCWWLRAVDGAVALNGAPLGSPAQLRDRDQIRIGEAYLEFASGERRTQRMIAADMAAPPRRPRYGRLPRPPRNVPVAAIGSIVLAAILVLGGAWVIWYGAFRATSAIVTLNDRQATELDSLLTVAYDHVERGGTLLELGLGD